ncbi:MAG: IS200/IS605 family transposase [Pyrinomonadaceae bacterium]|nr:IS200/IS605 family transposase [Blastocatellia bacterium]MCW5957042.1 IS200/IS605 family transposase [Pyrinomonadaceae bacterium]
MSHTRFLFHIVFGTKDRFPLINESWENELYAYLTGIVKKHNGNVIAINGMSDHIHILVRLEPGDFPAFMRELKASSSKWAKKHQPKFSWQRRYGAFTVSESAVDTVRNYIRNQKEHHRKRTFEDEYLELLRRHKVEFDEKYLWE